jgi:hypothetical protein
MNSVSARATAIRIVSKADGPAMLDTVLRLTQTSQPRGLPPTLP